EMFTSDKSCAVSAAAASAVALGDALMDLSSCPVGLAQTLSTVETVATLRNVLMKTSTDRILTTHTGSLSPRKPLIHLIFNREIEGAVNARVSEAEPANASDDAVARQVAAGIDVISDGEMSKPSYTTYIRHRVSGIEPDPRAAERGREIM